MLFKISYSTEFISLPIEWPQVLIISLNMDELCKKSLIDSLKGAVVTWMSIFDTAFIPALIVICICHSLVSQSLYSLDSILHLFSFPTIFPFLCLAHVTGFPTQKESNLVWGWKSNAGDGILYELKTTTLEKVQLWNLTFN